MSAEIIRKGTFDNMIDMLDRCIKYYNTNGRIKKNMYRLYKDGEYIDLFSSLVEISEFTGKGIGTVRNIADGQYNPDKWSIVKVDTSDYRDTYRSRVYIAKKDGVIQEFKTLSEMAIGLKMKEGTVKRFVYESSKDTLEGYTIEIID